MKEPLCPEDTPERYAPMYLRSEEEIMVFEKFKALHDFCQEKNIPCLLIGSTVPNDWKSSFALHHLHNKPNEQEIVRKNANVVICGMDAFLNTITKGVLQVRPVTDQSGEEWKNG